MPLSCSACLRWCSRCEFLKPPPRIFFISYVRITERREGQVFSDGESLQGRSPRYNRASDELTHEISNSAVIVFLYCTSHVNVLK